MPTVTLLPSKSSSTVLFEPHLLQEALQTASAFLNLPVLPFAFIASGESVLAPVLKQGIWRVDPFSMCSLYTSHTTQLRTEQAGEVKGLME